MASISTEKTTGRRIVQFTGVDGRRRSIRLGKVNKKQAKTIRLKVEKLVAAAITGHAPDDETARWVAEIQIANTVLAKRLANMGLIQSTAQPPDADATTTIGQFTSDFIRQFRNTVKAGTVTTWRHARRLLLEHFDPDMPISQMTEGRAVEFRAYLMTRDHSRIPRARKLSESTIRRRCGCLRQMFEHAVALEMISKNPFVSKRIPTTAPRLPQKAIVLPELSSRIMEHLPDHRWRLLFALARWGGLRVPSEPRRLKWCDVDWKRLQLTVSSPKTEHLAGHERRVIPIFPELLRPLQEAWDAAEEGQELVLPFTLDRTGASFRKPLIAAIRAAGSEPWPKLFNALRATRDTELREQFPSHVVDAWIGHDEAIAKKNYLQVTDEHYQRAAGGALQNPVQYPAALDCTSSQEKSATPEKPQELPPSAAPCEGVREYGVGDTGFEPVTSAM